MCRLTLFYLVNFMISEILFVMVFRDIVGSLIYQFLQSHDICRAVKRLHVSNFQLIFMLIVLIIHTGYRFNIVE